MKRTLALATVAVATAGIALAHPHFAKTVTATLPGGVQAKITYNTTPANEARADGAAVGEFVTPRGPVLDLSGRLGRGEKADAAKVIRLDSVFSKDEGTAPHMLIDVTPGSGKFEGKAVLTLHFGSLFLAGLLG